MTIFSALWRARNAAVARIRPETGHITHNPTSFDKLGVPYDNIRSREVERSRYGYTYYGPSKDG